MPPSCLIRRTDRCPPPAVDPVHVRLPVERSGVTLHVTDRPDLDLHADGGAGR